MKKIANTSTIVCPDCKGSGTTTIREDAYNSSTIKCKLCKGKRVIKATLTYEPI